MGVIEERKTQEGRHTLWGVEGEGVRAAEQQQQQGRAGHAVEYSKVREIV